MKSSIGQPGLPGGSVVKNLPGNAGGRLGLAAWIGKIPWGRTWQPTPGFLPGKSHGQRSLEGYSPWGCKESTMTEVIARTLGGGEETREEVKEGENASKMNSA